MSPLHYDCVVVVVECFYKAKSGELHDHNCSCSKLCNSTGAAFLLDQMNHCQSNCGKLGYQKSSEWCQKSSEVQFSKSTAAVVQDRAQGSTPAVTTDYAALIAMLNGLARNVQQPLGSLIAVLVHMKVQIKVAILGQGKDPAASPTQQ